MAFMRPSPPAVSQANTWWCWAACLEILSRAHPERFPRPMLTQSAWVAEMRQAPMASQILNRDGGLNTRFLPNVLNILGMRGQIWHGTRRRPLTPGGPVPPPDPPDIAFIEDKLRISYLLGLYTVPGGSHYVVIYGVDATHIHYFNPHGGIGNTRVTHADVRSNALIIAWKSP